MVLGIPTCTKVTPSHPLILKTSADSLPLSLTRQNSMKCSCCCSPSNCVPSSVTCFLPQGNYLLLTCLSPPLPSSHLVAESQELPQSCSQLHHPCLYTRATHQKLAKLTNSILLSPNTPTAPDLLHHFITSTLHTCGLGFAVFRWHSLSFPTPCFPFPTHPHMSFRKKKDGPQIWPKGSIKKQRACSPGLGGKGAFRGHGPEGGTVSCIPHT